MVHLCIYQSMNTNTSKRKKDSNSSEKDIQDASTGSVGNISRDKVVSSGTSFDEDKSIDKADIYSTEENGTRHLERAQEKPVEKVEDKEKGSWRIKERREDE
jgi:hypothetical protein